MDLAMNEDVSRDGIARMHDVIRPYIRQTRCCAQVGSDVGLEPFPLTFKLEFVQHAGRSRRAARSPTC